MTLTRTSENPVPCGVNVACHPRMPLSFVPNCDSVFAGTFSQGTESRPTMIAIRSAMVKLFGVGSPATRSATVRLP